MDKVSDRILSTVPRLNVTRWFETMICFDDHFFDFDSINNIMRNLQFYVRFDIVSVWFICFFSTTVTVSSRDDYWRLLSLSRRTLEFSDKRCSCFGILFFAHRPTKRLVAIVISRERCVHRVWFIYIYI